MWEQALRRLAALSVTLNPFHGNKHTDREAGVRGTGRFITHQYDIWGGGDSHMAVMSSEERDEKNPAASFMRKA